MKKLPIGIQSFENLREDDYLYIDKTETIYNLVSSGRVYFLSRPRRFGKSLLISTMEALFSGRQELFEGLWIYGHWNWTQQYPVIRIDWTRIKHSTPEEMEISMTGFLQDTARKYELNLTKKFTSDCLAELIEQLHLKTGRKVAVLVDEYDVPLLDAIDSSQEAIKKIRIWIHDFYRILKATDEHLRFIFLTGASKFSGLSVFSALNNLDDITLLAKYATICGYTQQEMENYFSDYIDDASKELNMAKETLLENIRYWYDGYTWDGKTSMYNPFSTLLFFNTKEIANYWFRTGTPAFLINILRQRGQLNVVLEAFTVGANIFDSFDPEAITAEPLLFQTGYLTVKQKILTPEGRPQYTLALPNREVEESLLEHLLAAYTQYPVEQAENLRMNMQQHIRQSDAAGLENDLRRMLAHIPYELHIAKEAYYHSIFLIWIKLLGFDIQGEIMTNTGRIDAVWQEKDLTVVTEIKFHAEKTAGILLNEAMKQIRNRRYYEKYLHRKIRLMGVAFSGKEVACRIENI
jgi:hypothetical protein